MLSGATKLRGKKHRTAAASSSKSDCCVLKRVFILISWCDEFLKYSTVNVKNPANHLHFSYGHTHSSITLSFTLNHSYHFIHDFTVFSIYLLNFNFFLNYTKKI